MHKEIDTIKAQLIEQEREIKYYKELLEDISNRNLRELEESSNLTALLNEQKRIQNERQKVKRLESIGLMAGSVAHDLNNILMGIISYPELLLLKLPEDSPLRDTIMKIQDSGNRAAAVVADLLTVARGVANIKAVYDLNDIVKEYLSSPQHDQIIARFPHIEFHLDLSATPLLIDCSSPHITKSILNLVNNAAEAIGERGTVSIKTNYGDRTNYPSLEPYIQLQINDNGPGIEKNSLDKLFEPFFTKKVFGRSGTGLGLTVVWNTMEDHEGFIEVDSTNFGTCFSLYFPISQGDNSEKTSPQKPALLNGEGSILVVDDERLQRDVASEILKTLGYDVVSVSSGEEAVSYLTQNTIDMVLLDMIMVPGMNGRETYEEIIKIRPRQKALIASGYSESEDVKKAYRLGVGGFLSKPYSIDQLGKKVNEVLRS